MAGTITINVDPKKDVLDIKQGKLMTHLKGHKVEPGMVYEVTLESTVKYHGNAYPVNKIVVYNTTNHFSKGWFYVIEEGCPTMIKIGTSGTEHDKVYVFLVDITSEDNTGHATVTFKPVCK